MSINRMIKERIRPNLLAGTILEIGPSPVFMGLPWLQSYPDMEWLGAGFLESERAKAEAVVRGRRLFRRVGWSQAPLPRLDLASQSVDVLVSFGAMHAWQQPVAVLNEAARVLKKDGDFFIGDVRPDATSWQRLWAQLIHPGWRPVYRADEDKASLETVTALVRQSGLNHAGIELMGPDLWVTKAKVAG